MSEQIGHLNEQLNLVKETEATWGSRVSSFMVHVTLKKNTENSFKFFTLNTTI